MSVVEHVLAAEGSSDRQVHVLGKFPQVADGIAIPAATADDHEGPLGLCKQRLHVLQLVGTRMHLHLLVSRCVADGGMGGQHVFRQGDHDRAGTSVDCAVEGLADEFRNACGIVDLHDPFGHLAEHAAIIDFLKRLALDLIAGNLPDKSSIGVES